MENKIACPNGGISAMNRGIESLNQLHLVANNYLEIKSINLHMNKIQRIENLSLFTQLTELNLSGNEISRMEGLSNLSSLRMLDLSCNLIQHVDGLSSMRQLRALILSFNKIKNLSGMTVFRSPEYQLECLDLRSNCISDLDQLKFLGGVSTLQQIDILDPSIPRAEQNPVVFLPNYRSILLQCVASVSRVDGQQYGISIEPPDHIEKIDERDSYMRQSSNSVFQERENSCVPKRRKKITRGVNTDHAVCINTSVQSDPVIASSDVQQTVDFPFLCGQYLCELVQLSDEAQRDKLNVFLSCTTAKCIDAHQDMQKQNLQQINQWRKKYAEVEQQYEKSQDQLGEAGNSVRQGQAQIQALKEELTRRAGETNRIEKQCRQLHGQLQMIQQQQVQQQRRFSSFYQNAETEKAGLQTQLVQLTSANASLHDEVRHRTVICEELEQRIGCCQQEIRNFTQEHQRLGSAMEQLRQQMGQSKLEVSESRERQVFQLNFFIDHLGSFDMQYGLMCQQMRKEEVLLRTEASRASDDLRKQCLSEQQEVMMLRELVEAEMEECTKLQQQQVLKPEVRSSLSQTDALLAFTKSSQTDTAVCQNCSALENEKQAALEKVKLLESQMLSLQEITSQDIEHVHQLAKEVPRLAAENEGHLRAVRNLTESLKNKDEEISSMEAEAREALDRKRQRIAELTHDFEQMSEEMDAVRQQNRVLLQKEVENAERVVTVDRNAKDVYEQLKFAVNVLSSRVVELDKDNQSLQVELQQRKENEERAKEQVSKTQSLLQSKEFQLLDAVRGKEEQRQTLLDLKNRLDRLS